MTDALTLMRYMVIAVKHGYMSTRERADVLGAPFARSWAINYQQQVP